jgi:hypothetical protein
MDQLGHLTVTISMLLPCACGGSGATSCEKPTAHTHMSHESFEGLVLGMGNPLLDISAHVGTDLIEKYVLVLVVVTPDASAAPPKCRVDREFFSCCVLGSPMVSAVWPYFACVETAACTHTCRFRRCDSIVLHALCTWWGLCGPAGVRSCQCR